jgi:pyrroline-5-carboxylate reductase
MRIAFIGGGTMGEAIIKCLLAKAVVTPGDLVVSDVSGPRRELLSREYGVSALADNRKATEGCDMIVLAVKPEHLAQVMDELKTPLPQQTVVSIVAGAGIPSLCRGLNCSSVVRAMPNMPAQIGEGMTVWTATAEVTEKQKETAQSIFGALGEEIYVPDEKYLDMATAVSGSGPAYVFLFIEGLIDAGVHIGLPRNIAEELVIQTVLGSTHTVKKTTRHPAELRNMVTSPGGTTTEAVLQLEKGRFRSLLLEAVAAAYEKAKHL